MSPGPSPGGMAGRRVGSPFPSPRTRGSSQATRRGTSIVSPMERATGPSKPPRRPPGSVVSSRDEIPAPTAMAACCTQDCMDWKRARSAGRGTLEVSAL